MYICRNYLVAISQFNAHTFKKNVVILLRVCACLLGTLHLSENFELDRKPYLRFLFHSHFPMVPECYNSSLQNRLLRCNQKDRVQFHVKVLS